MESQAMKQRRREGQRRFWANMTPKQRAEHIAKISGHQTPHLHQERCGVRIEDVPEPKGSYYEVWYNAREWLRERGLHQ